MLVIPDLESVDLGKAFTINILNYLSAKSELTGLDISNEMVVLFEMVNGKVQVKDKNFIYPFKKNTCSQRTIIIVRIKSLEKMRSRQAVKIGFSNFIRNNFERWVKLKLVYLVEMRIKIINDEVENSHTIIISRTIIIVYYYIFVKISTPLDVTRTVCSN